MAGLPPGRAGLEQRELEQHTVLNNRTVLSNRTALSNAGPEQRGP
jgi:hypothetical protein